MKVAPPVLPTSTNLGLWRPIDAMPFGSDSAKSKEESAPQRIPDRPPVSAKPPPPEAPQVSQEVRSVQGSERGVRSSPNQSRSSEEAQLQKVDISKFQAK